MSMFSKYRRISCLLLLFVLLATWLSGLRLLPTPSDDDGAPTPATVARAGAVGIAEAAASDGNDGGDMSRPLADISNRVQPTLRPRLTASPSAAVSSYSSTFIDKRGPLRFLFPLPLMCPMAPLSTWNRTAAVNATMFHRIVHPFLMANRTLDRSQSPQPWADAAARTADGPLCFGEIAGMDYNSGREHDLAELRGATLDLCLHMCLQRNALLDEKLRAVKHSNRSDSHWKDAFALKRCASVVYYGHGKICWLKREGPLQKKMTDANSYVLGAHQLPLTRSPSVLPSHQTNAGYSTISASIMRDDASLGSGGRAESGSPFGVSASRWRHHRGESLLTTTRPQQPPPPAAAANLVLYAVLSEHHYVTSRMLPALQTWLRDEHVAVLLVKSTEAEHRRSEELLAPALSFRATPSTVRVVMYLKRNSLQDLPQDPHTPKTVEGFKRSMVTTTAGGGVHRRPLPNVPMMQSRAAREALDKRLRHILSRNNLHRQWDRGEFRLAKDSGAWKDLPGIDVVFGRFRNYSFYMVIDDDAYIIQRNFQILLSSFYLSKWHPWNATLYSGVLSLWYQPISENRAVVVPFIQGGAGILISNAAMAQVHPFIQRCRFACDYLPHGDVRLGCCMKSVAKIDAFYETTFWHMHVYRAQGRDVRQNRSLFPVSFHRMKNASMMMPLHDCVVAEEARLNGMGGVASLAAPVTWEAVMACYEWMRGRPEHEYKFAMQELH